MKNMKRSSTTIMPTAKFLRQKPLVFLRMKICFYKKILRKIRRIFVLSALSVVLAGSYLISPLSLSKSSMSVPLTFLMAIFSISFSAKESGASLIGFLSMA